MKQCALKTVTINFLAIRDCHWLYWCTYSVCRLAGTNVRTCVIMLPRHYEYGHALPTSQLPSQGSTLRLSHNEHTLALPVCTLCTVSTAAQAATRVHRLAFHCCMLRTQIVPLLPHHLIPYDNLLCKSSGGVCVLGKRKKKKRKKNSPGNAMLLPKKSPGNVVAKKKFWE